MPFAVALGVREGLTLHSLQDFEAEFGYAQSTDGTTPIYSTRIDEFRSRFSDVVAGWTHDGAKVPTLNVTGMFGLPVAWVEA